MPIRAVIVGAGGQANRFSMDAESVMGLVTGAASSEREVISEYHSEGVLAPCFMIRRGQAKYIYIHKEEDQLFDLARDPGEWHNQAGDPDKRDLVESLRAAILSRFDPEAIHRTVEESLKSRQLLKRAMQRNDTNWDYAPHFDATRQYIRRPRP